MVIWKEVNPTPRKIRTLMTLYFHPVTALARFNIHHHFGATLDGFRSPQFGGELVVFRPLQRRERQCVEA